MALVITREQRDAIYEEVLEDLAGIDDVLLLIKRGEYEAARAHRRRSEDDWRLLDDLGWEAAQPDDRDEFELTMSRGELARALQRLNDKAGKSCIGMWSCRSRIASRPSGRWWRCPPLATCSHS